MVLTPALDGVKNSRGVAQRRPSRRSVGGVSGYTDQIQRLSVHRKKVVYRVEIIPPGNGLRLRDVGAGSDMVPIVSNERSSRSGDKEASDVQRFPTRAYYARNRIFGLPVYSLG